MEAKEHIQKRTQIPGFGLLEELSLNLRWSWNHRTDKIWQLLDEQLWEDTRNPWIILQTVSREKLERFLGDDKFCSEITELVEANRKEANSQAWFQKTFTDAPVKNIAYFSMEYMLTEALPIYSGGLGNVAGDQLKAASDLGVPVTAIGLLYQEGYFRQLIDKEGAQQALYPYNDPGQLPIKPLRKSDGEWLRLEITLPGHSLWIRTWHVRVGRANLYLLDSNDMSNFPAHRGITTELYGGGSEVRLKQEIILGIGGWRLLEALGIEPEVCHLNEGHAAFVVLERARSYMEKHKTSFEVALAATRPGNIFTTHTAVPAGFDCFFPVLMEQYLGLYAQNNLHISSEALMSLGRVNSNDYNEPFNMAYLALRGSGFINGVSRIHADVSKELFAPLFPRWPKESIPIGYVTNGVHMPSWDSADADTVWASSCGKNRWFEPTEALEKYIHSLSDNLIWKMKNAERLRLTRFVGKRLSNQKAAFRACSEEVEEAKTCLKPDVLTLGFARRFATYKRPNLLLSDPERFIKILNNVDCPVQLIIAGKAHPADEPGKALILEWNRFIKRKDVGSKVVFLSDYDMLITEELVKGVDVWINNPRKPWEACGTSGMKVLVNGGLNLSELDGWWAEAYSPAVGWALGTDENAQHLSDAEEANNLYTLLEQQIIPEFYNRNNEGLPVKWIEKIRESMAQLTAKYSSNRSVREYTENYYIPAAKHYANRNANGTTIAQTIVDNKKTLEEHWHNLSFGSVQITNDSNQYEFTVPVFLNGIDPKSIKIELYADGQKPCEMQLQNPTKDSSGASIYSVMLPATEPSNSYTPRIIPQVEGTEIPLEITKILWQR